MRLHTDEELWGTVRRQHYLLQQCDTIVRLLYTGVIQKERESRMRIRIFSKFFRDSSFWCLRNTLSVFPCVMWLMFWLWWYRAIYPSSSFSSWCLQLFISVWYAALVGGRVKVLCWHLSSQPPLWFKFCYSLLYPMNNSHGFFFFPSVNNRVDRIWETAWFKCLNEECGIDV